MTQDTQKTKPPLSDALCAIVPRTGFPTNIRRQMHVNVAFRRDNNNDLQRLARAFGDKILRVTISGR